MIRVPVEAERSTKSAVEETERAFMAGLSGNKC